MASIELLATLEGHTDRAWHLSWSPSSPLLASCSSDKSIRFYHFTPVGQFTPTTSIPQAHQRTIRSLSFSPTGQTLSTASFDATVGIWQKSNEAGIEDGAGMSTGNGDEGDWEAVDPLEGHESECKSVEWSHDGRLVASCSRDKSVWVWEAVGPAEFECLAVLMEHTQDVKSVTWHPSEELLASASYDDTIRLYTSDPYDDEWSTLCVLQSHTATVWTLSFSPCGRYLASAGDDLVIKLWGRDSREDEIQLGEDGLAKKEDGGRMGPWSKGGVRIGDKEKWKWILKGEVSGAHDRTIYSIDWAAGGLPESEGGLGRIVTGGGDGRLNVYQMTKPAETNGVPQHSLLARVEEAHGVSDVNHVSWCKLSPSKAAATLRALEGGEDDPEMAAAESGVDQTEEDGRWKGSRDWFASAGDDGVVRVWKVVDGSMAGKDEAMSTAE